MPKTVTVKLPSGKTVTVQGVPEGLSEDDFKTQFQSRHPEYFPKDQSGPASGASSSWEPAEETGLVAGVKRGVRNLIHTPGAILDAATKPGGVALNLVGLPMAEEHEKAVRSHQAEVDAGIPQFGDPGNTGHPFLDQTIGRVLDLGDKPTKTGAKVPVDSGDMHDIASVVPFAGPWASDLTQRSLKGDTSGAAGELATTMMVPKILGDVLPGRVAELTRPAPVTRGQAISSLRRAVNPDAGDAPGFLRELNDQADTVIRHAQTNGLEDSPYGHLDSLAKTVKAAAKADPYRKTFIDPYANENVSTSGVKGYSGGTTDYGRATIEQLDARLSEINKTVTPRYMRGPDGSVQQVAAVGAEQIAPLQAEAAGIRNTLAQELSKRTGVPADQIAAARKNYGQLNDLADTAQHYADKSFQKQTATQQSGANLETTATGVLTKGAKAVWRGGRGQNPSQLIRNALKYQPPEATPPPEIAPPGTSPLRPLPAWTTSAPPPEIPIQRTGEPPPVTQTGKPMTVRAQAAADAYNSAQDAARTASVAPPSGAQAEQLAPTVLQPQYGPIPTPGGVLQRPMPALPPGPKSPPTGLSEQGSPIPLGPSSLPDEVSNALPTAESPAIPEMIARAADRRAGPPRDPTIDTSRISSFRSELANETDPAKIAQLNQAIEHEKSVMAARTPQLDQTLRSISSAPPSGGRVVPQTGQTTGSELYDPAVHGEPSSLPAPLQDMVTPSPPPEAVPTSQPEPRISVIHPAGQTGTVPVSHVPQAIKEGYQLAQPLAPASA